MKVRLTGDITGNRNGQPWPSKGSEVVLPDDEGAALCKSGMAVPVADDKTEKAAQPEESEKRTLTTKSVK